MAGADPRLETVTTTSPPATPVHFSAHQPAHSPHPKELSLASDSEEHIVNEQPDFLSGAADNSCCRIAVLLR